MIQKHGKKCNRQTKGGNMEPEESAGKICNRLQALRYRIPVIYEKSGKMCNQ